MPLTAAEVFRDFVGWDDAHPLPIGKPDTGVHNPRKKEIRDWAGAFEEGAQEAVGEASRARDEAVSAASSTQAELASRVYAAANYHPEIAPDKIRVAGFAAAGDGGAALYERSAAMPDHPGRFSITLAGGSVAWYSIAETVVDARMFGAVPDNMPGAGAKIADAAEFLSAKGGGTVRISGRYDVSDVDAIELRSRVTVALDNAEIRQKGTGNKSVFLIRAGARDITITGRGQIIGPAESRPPSPDTGYELYPRHNCGLKIVGTHRRRVTNVHVGVEVHIWGWDVSGIFAECTKDCTFWARVGKCGVDGIRYYGDDSSNNQMAYIYDIGPGKDGVAPHLNAYGVVATRRPQRTQRLADPLDPAGAAWELKAITAVAGSSAEPYDGTDLGRIAETAASSMHRLSQDYSGSLSALQFVSVVAEATPNCDFFRLELANTTDNNSYIRVHYDLSTGQVLAYGVSGGAEIQEYGIEHLGGSRYRCWFIGRLNGVSGGLRWCLWMLPTKAISITGGAFYVGNPSRTLNISGMQLVEATAGVFMEYGEPLVVNPKSRRTKIGCRVHNVEMWAGLDTHGGEYIDFSGGHVTRCWIAFNLDNGETSGATTNDAPHVGAQLVNLFADAEDLTDTAAGIACVAKVDARSKGVLIDNVYLRGYGGPDDYGDGRPTLGRGAIFLNNADGFTIGSNVVLDQCKGTALTINGDCPQGQVGSLYVRNLQPAGGNQTLIRTTGSAIGAVKIEVPRREGAGTLYSLTGNAWVQGGYFPSSSRPNPGAGTGSQGANIFDTTLSKPLFWSGTQWRDATGAPAP